KATKSGVLQFIFAGLEGDTMGATASLIRARFSCRLLLCMVLCWMATSLHGQGYFGTISGDITDPSKAAVPDARVTLLDQQKGYQFTTTSDKSGRYVFTSVPPGTYSVSAQVPGFEKIIRENVTVDVSTNATANLALKVATARQSVDVVSQ